MSENKTTPKKAKKPQIILDRSTGTKLLKNSLTKARSGAGGFMDFVREQNVMGMAVGLVLGGAAGGLVNSLINNIIMPPLGLLLGSANGIRGLAFKMGTTATGEEAVLHYGIFINDLINFLVLAFVIYVVVKALKLNIKK